MTPQIYFNIYTDIIVFGVSALLSLTFPIFLRIKGKTAPLIYLVFLFLGMLILGIVTPHYIKAYRLPWYYVYLEYMSACFIG